MKKLNSFIFSIFIKFCSYSLNYLNSQPLDCWIRTPFGDIINYYFFACCSKIWVPWMKPSDGTMDLNWEDVSILRGFFILFNWNGCSFFGRRYALDSVFLLLFDEFCLSIIFFADSDCYLERLWLFILTKILLLGGFSSINLLLFSFKMLLLF